MLIKILIKKFLRIFNLELSIIQNQEYADISFLEKAKNFQERFKDVISDPLNLLIDRVPQAGYLDEHLNVILHNGNKVPSKGKYSYYGNFSDLLIYNRGVHEPLEEYCFQQVLKNIKTVNPSMIELGAYWGHYAMWFKKELPDSRTILVESESANLDCGRFNFDLNGYSGEFINQAVCKDQFEVDKFLLREDIYKLEILHSDIQGHEVEMLKRTSKSLNKKLINYLFISTHSEAIHSEVLEIIESHNYRIEISSSFETHTTSFDGFILATNPDIPRVFKNFHPMGRVEILHASTKDLINSITDIS
ncbi:hypothetical protein OAQ46_00995 [Gammaproteobacteria bacterium]|nr:hypothetical protein [Gammaproteobacteria bacterium]